jgi:hypothetical protein
MDMKTLPLRADTAAIVADASARDGASLRHRRRLAASGGQPLARRRARVVCLNEDGDRNVERYRIVKAK